MSETRTERELLIDNAIYWLEKGRYSILSAPEIYGFKPAVFGERPEEGVNKHGYVTTWTSKCLIEIVTSDSLEKIPDETRAKAIFKWRSEYTTRKVVLMHSRERRELAISKLPGFDLYLCPDDIRYEKQKEAV